MLEGCLEETLRTTFLTRRAERIRSVFSLVGGRVSEGGRIREEAMTYGKGGRKRKEGCVARVGSTCAILALSRGLKAMDWHKV